VPGREPRTRRVRSARAVENLEATLDRVRAHADDDLAGRNVVQDDGVGADEGAVPDGDGAEDFGASAGGRLCG
jgi:hypothetical protein